VIVPKKAAEHRRTPRALCAKLPRKAVPFRVSFGSATRARVAFSPSRISILTIHESPLTIHSRKLSEFSSRKRGCSSMVERQLPKLHTRVRFPSPAPAFAWSAAKKRRRGRPPQPCAKADHELRRASRPSDALRLFAAIRIKSEAAVHWFNWRPSAAISSAQ
jgi:hypothetical protein